MKEFFTEIAPLMPWIVRILYAIAVLMYAKQLLQFMRDMLSEPDNRLSSRRGVAMGAAWTLFYLCIEYYKDINSVVLWVLLLLIILCLGLATLPQIMELWGSIRATIAGVKSPDKQAPAPPPVVNVNNTTEVVTQPQS